MMKLWNRICVILIPVIIVFFGWAISDFQVGFMFGVWTNIVCNLVLDAGD